MLKGNNELPRPRVAGLMQDTPLLISDVIIHADKFHADREIISRLPETPTQLHYSNYRTAAKHSRQLANALLTKFNIQQGDIIGTLAFNHIYHFECYFGISGIGAVLHTVNPRLFPEQLEYIINHANDRMLFIDTACVSILCNTLKDGKKINCVEHIVILTEPQHHKQYASQLSDALRQYKCNAKVHNYIELLNDQSDQIQWPSFNDSTASSLCYTSGTTGNPKGVLYSHRSTIMHSTAVMSRDVLGVYSGDSICLVVPLFHVNAWGVPYAAAACGARLLMPGTASDGANLTDLIIKGEATVVLGVPTVYLGLFQFWDSKGMREFKSLDRVVIGGSAAPESMIRRFLNMNVAVLHAWGMSEMSPLGSTGQLLPKHRSYTQDQLLKVLVKQGRGVFGVQMRIVDENGAELAWDGKQAGELQVRGPWVTRAYFRIGSESSNVQTGNEKPNTDNARWFSTGDVCTIDSDGYIQITDRSKDVIKSGGEWISSIDLENVVVGHDAVQEACVVGHHHTKWQERPLLLVVLKEGKSATAEDIKQYLKPKIISWWMPNVCIYFNMMIQCNRIY